MHVHPVEKEFQDRLTVVLLDYVHRVDDYRDANYASVTAPQLTYVEVRLDEQVLDGVWVGPGSSHSWWTQAGGKLLKRGMKRGQRLLIRATNGAALRIDWDDEYQ